MESILLFLLWDRIKPPQVSSRDLAENSLLLCKGRVLVSSQHHSNYLILRGRCPIFLSLVLLPKVILSQAREQGLVGSLTVLYSPFLQTSIETLQVV